MVASFAATIFVAAGGASFGDDVERADANPFRGVDVVALFARTSGTVRERFHLHGRPDPRRAVIGRLGDGTWVLIAPFDGGTSAAEAIVYRETGRDIEPVGALHSPTGGIRVSVEKGIVAESFPIFHPTGRCSAAGREIRSFAIRGHGLHEIARRTDPAGFVVTLDSHVPRDARGRVRVDLLAAHTRGLYRECDGVRLGDGDGEYLLGDDIDLGGVPYAREDVWFSEGPARLVAVPFVSGGSGGVFDAAVYRVDTERVVLAGTVHANGHLTMRAVGDTLEVASPTPSAEPDCCYTHVDVTTYRFDLGSGRLIAVAVRRREATDTWMRGVRG